MCSFNLCIPVSENVLAYNKLVAELEEMVTRMVFETYGVEKYLDAHRKMVTYLCRGMKYRPPVANETNMGFVPHTDKDFITVLHQNGVNGLEVKARDGEWFSVELEPSSYIVMSGDAAMVSHATICLLKNNNSVCRGNHLTLMFFEKIPLEFLIK